MLLGLRFHRADGPLLRDYADRVRRGEFGVNASANTFTQAAIAAETGEPLEVHCSDPMEVVQIAAMYVLHGCRQPVIDELSQPG